MNKKCIWVISILFSLLIIGNKVLGQTNPNVVRMPSSPEAYSMFKASEIPVGHFSGTANVSVPVYNIELGDFSWPISLSYNTSGIKTEEMSSNIGLGWNLNASGMLNAMINGKDDMSSSNGGYPLNSTNAPNYSGGPLYYYMANPPSLNEEYNLFKRFANGELDWAIDLYSFNAGSFSGKFFYDQYQQVHTIPLSQTKIKKVGGFQVIDDKGVTFHFSDSDIEMSEYSACYSINNQGTYLLSRITTSKGNTISFVYDTITYTYTTMNSEMLSRKLFGFECPASGDNPTSSNTCDTLSNTVHSKLLKKIISSNGDVVTFNYSSISRKDLPGAKFLESIVVKYKDVDFIKKINLTHSYFGDTTGLSTTCRLKLTNIIEESGTGLQRNLHNLTYNEDVTIPNRLSKSQDHWGYYNGKPNTTLLPSSLEFNHFGADRNPDINYAKAGSLKKITYPTGGFSMFEYEPNDYWAINEKIDSFGYFTGPGYNSVYNGDTSYSITIPANAKNITLVRNMNDCPSSELDPDNCIITFSNGSNVNYSFDCHSSLPMEYIVDIPAGAYTVTLNTTGSIVYSSFNVKYFLDYSYYLTGNKQSGGMRIKNISSQADSLSNPQVTNYIYRQFVNRDVSSGQYIWLPQYEYGQSIYKWKNLDGFYYGCNQNSEWDNLTAMETQYHILRSNSILPLSNVDGGNVGYENVTEIKQDTTYGKTEFTYKMASDPGGDYGYPFSVRGSNAWKRGQLLKKVNYKFNSSTSSLTPLNKEENFYSVRPYSDFWNRLYTTESDVNETYKGMGLQVMYKLPEIIHDMGVDGAQFFTGIYHYESKWFRMDSTKQTHYSGNDQLESTSRLSYNGLKHLQVTSQSTTNSEGLTENVNMLYPQDSIGVTVMDSLISRNRLSEPIETKKYINSILTKKSRPQYKIWTNPIIEIEQMQSAIGSNALENDVTITSYDIKGNITQYQKRDGIVNSIIRDYDTTYIVSSIVNAPLGDCAFTSFEATGKGGWTCSDIFLADTTAPTGKKCFNLSNGNISKTGLSSTTYTVSYWSKNGAYTVNSASPILTGKTLNGWTYFQHEVTGTSVSITGGGLIDEVRLYPKKALMTTYTYLPLVGLSSQCDVNNKITYYEYDASKRLALVKDEDKNILKKICYNFAGETENCN